MRTFLLTIFLFIPLVLVAEEDQRQRSASVTVTVQVEFVERPMSGLMTEEEIEESSRGSCYANPDNLSEIICE